MSIRKVIEQINNHKRFLITSHINLEGDALGAQLALRALLLRLGKKAVIVDEDRAPEEYSFLPGIKNIKMPKEVRNFNFDAFIALDCSDETRCKEVFARFSQGLPKINIDHHISNSNFGDANWIDTMASSTSEMIYGLYKKMGIALNKVIALWLYVGILTDTGSFRYPNTSPSTHKIASDLTGYGINLSDVHKNIYEKFTFQDLRLLSGVLMTVRQDPSGKIVWFEMSKKIINKKRKFSDLSEQVLNFGRLVKDAEVIVLFKEEIYPQPQVRINLRSKGNFNVNKVAQFFNGGGHKNASGCSLRGRLKNVEDAVINKIRDRIK